MDTVAITDSGVDVALGMSDVSDGVGEGSMAKMMRGWQS